MGFYSDLASVATRLLTDKGKNLTFSRSTSTGFNPVTGVDTVTASTYTAYGAAFNYNAREIDGVLIQSGDIRLIIEATSTPIIGDSVTLDSIVYRVMDVKTTSPAGVPVMYELILRK